MNTPVALLVISLSYPLKFGNFTSSFSIDGCFLKWLSNSNDQFLMANRTQRFVLRFFWGQEPKMKAILFYFDFSPARVRPENTIRASTLQ